MQSIDTTKKVICTEKANGEAAHISVWKLLNETFYCIGSKNVHMLLKDIGKCFVTLIISILGLIAIELLRILVMSIYHEIFCILVDDVTKYKEPRFDFARRIANAFFTTYILNPEISEDKKKCLIEFMLDNGLTAVAEIIQPDNQHVVNLSHLKHSELRYTYISSCLQFFQFLHFENAMAQTFNDFAIDLFAGQNQTCLTISMVVCVRCQYIKRLTKPETLDCKPFNTK